MGVVHSALEFARDAVAFGLTSAVKMYRPGPSGELIALDTPEFGKIYIRRGDSDYQAMRQVLRKAEYAITVDHVRDSLARRYALILAAGHTPVIIDAGANIGLASLWFAYLYPNAKVIAIEPDPNNASVLRKNVKQRPNVVVVEAAIGATPGFVCLEKNNTSWGIMTERSTAGCPIVTVDQLLADVESGETLIVKIDIEGFEDDLFSKNIGWIDHSFAIFIEPHDWMLPGRKSSRGFQKAMAAHDFDLFLCGENLLFVHGTSS